MVGSEGPVVFWKGLKMSQKCPGCPKGARVGLGGPGAIQKVWDIFRPFQKTTGPSEPTKGPPRPSKSSLGHPQTLLDDHSDPHEGSLDPRRLYWDISRSAQRLLRAPGPIVGAARPFQGPTGPTWGLPGSSLDISRLFWMSPEPPGCPQTSLGRLQILLHDSKWGKGGLWGGEKGVSGASVGWKGSQGVERGLCGIWGGGRCEWGFCGV